MAEEEDRSSKTEDPTQRKLDEAHRKGQVVRSLEVGNWAMVGAGTLVVALFAGSMMNSVAHEMFIFLESPHAIPVDGVAVAKLMRDLGVALAKLMAGPTLLLFVIALAATALQHRLVLSFERLQPKLSNLSIIKGIKSKFSLKTLIELVKSLVKFGIVAGVLWWIVWPRRDVLLQVHTLELAGLLHVMEDIALDMLIAIIAAMTLIAAADYVYQWWDHHQQLRMSLKDIRDEHKDSEGDPHVKARIRKIRQERANKRMLLQVPKATVVVTNPTHFAVALRYAPEEKMNAPVVVAKGADLIAQKIREVAQEHKVPIVENPPLARALYATAELDQEVPVEHFKAVAEVISYVLRLRRPRRQRPAGQKPGRGGTAQ